MVASTHKRPYKKRQAIGHENFTRLYDWLVVPQNSADCYTLGELAQKAEQALGIPHIPLSALTKAMHLRGVTLAQKPSVRKPRARSDTQIVALQVNDWHVNPAAPMRDDFRALCERAAA